MSKNYIIFVFIFFFFLLFSQKNKLSGVLTGSEKRQFIMPLYFTFSRVFLYQPHVRIKTGNFCWKHKTRQLYFYDISNQYADYLEDITVTDEKFRKYQLVENGVVARGRHKNGSIKIKETPQVTELVILK
jgi:hypothetical protein